jgi:hypothetical protein
VFYSVETTALQNMRKANDITFDISERVHDRITYASLGGKINYSLRFVNGKTLFNGFAVPKIDTHVGISRVICMASNPSFFESRIVVVIVVIDPDYSITAL